MDKNSKSGNPVPRPGQMPSPPEFLTRPHPTEGITYPAMIEEHVPASMPKSIDFGLYQNVLDERKQAEMSAAEIYAKYLEVVTFNEKLLRTQRIFDRYQARVRRVYDRALDVESRHSEDLLRARRHQMAVEKSYNDLQIEAQSLRASNQAHEEAFQGILVKLGQAEAQLGGANGQFQSLAEEFDNRGILLEEADRHIQGYRSQIEQFQNSIREWQDKYSKLRDDNLLMQADLREMELKEAGIATLNNELAMSVTKSQRQIYELEDKMTREREESKARIAYLEAELDKALEQKRVEALLEKARKIQAGESLNAKPGEVYKPVESGQPREEWNNFYQRWSHIIDELTTQSNMVGRTGPTPALPEKTDDITGELVSEAGELEII